MHSAAILIILAICIILILILLIIPFSGKKSSNRPISYKLDERDTMFSRNSLVPGTRQFEAYYKLNPQFRAKDDLFRKNPGLLSNEAHYFHPLMFMAARALDKSTQLLVQGLTGDVSSQETELSPEQITLFLKKWGKQLGAHTIGIAEVKDYHLYSYKGRGKAYGEKILNRHRYAIVITIEMDYHMMLHAPAGPTFMESNRQYFNVGAIAVHLASFIRELGYDAKAHIDANYDFICPTIARDAGLGEIGRMGLLMTPGLGPRVRISVVSTDIPLISDQYRAEPSMIDFCLHCKKCAVVCPAHAISFDEPKEIDGAFRWKIQSEACFTYWQQAGTDCGKCVIVCPYSHPSGILHNLIRAGIRNSHLFRIVAIHLDDLFYGKRPGQAPLKEWMR